MDSLDPLRDNRQAASEQLHRTLVELATELDETPELNPVVRAELAEIAEKIRASLNREVSEPAETAQPAKTPESLDRFAVEFSASHPRLARMIEEVTKALAGIGI